MVIENDSASASATTSQSAPPPTPNVAVKPPPKLKNHFRRLEDMQVAMPKLRDCGKSGGSSQRTSSSVISPLFGSRPRHHQSTPTPTPAMLISLPALLLLLAQQALQICRNLVLQRNLHSNGNRKLRGQDVTTKAYQQFETSIDIQRPGDVKEKTEITPLGVTRILRIGRSVP